MKRRKHQGTLVYRASERRWQAAVMRDGIRVSFYAKTRDAAEAKMRYYLHDHLVDKVIFDLSTAIDDLKELRRPGEFVARHG